jgi:hypothetical protein
MHFRIPLEKLNPVEITTALKLTKFIEIFDLKVWGTF